jgi:Ni/Co efflux regulator RcnB
MTSKAIVSAAVAAAMGFGSAAQAQGWHQGAQDHQQRQQHSQRYDRPAQQHWQGRQHWEGRQYAAPQYQARSYDHAPRYYAQPQYQGRSYDAPRYAGNYYRSYDSGYRTYHRRWVNDWRARHWSPPPYGYGYVEDDSGDVLLIALATGLIANAILGQ